MPRIRHAFSSAAPQGTDATKVRKNDWNADHTFSNINVALSGDTALAWGTHESVYGSAGASDITLTLPTAVGHAGERIRIKRTSSAAGNVVIATTSAQTIDGAANYTLYNQYQFVELESDGSNWLIWGGN